MKKLLYVITICLLLSPATIAANGGTKKEAFYEQISRGIIRLEHYEKVIKEGSNIPESRNVPDGTGFFIGSETELYVVSARHVVEKDYSLHARVQCKHKKTGNMEVIYLTLPRERWIFHPDKGDKDTHYVDVAAQKIRFIKDRTVKCFRYEPKDSKDFKENQLPLEDAIPPQPILVFGFPGDIGFQLLEQRPFGRSGIIAMLTGKEFLKVNATKFAEKRCNLIDAEIFPGNSGSPVINQMNILDREPKLLGIVIASNSRMDFAVMEPVSRIREVLDLAKEQSTEGLSCWFEKSVFY
jgi:hypothetical protein